MKTVFLTLTVFLLTVGNIFAQIDSATVDMPRIDSTALVQNQEWAKLPGDIFEQETFLPKAALYHIAHKLSDPEARWDKDTVFVNDSIKNLSDIYRIAAKDFDSVQDTTEYKFIYSGRFDSLIINVELKPSGFSGMLTKITFETKGGPNKSPIRFYWAKSMNTENIRIYSQSYAINITQTGSEIRTRRSPLQMGIKGTGRLMGIFTEVGYSDIMERVLEEFNPDGRIFN